MKISPIRVQTALQPNSAQANSATSPNFVFFGLNKGQQAAVDIVRVVDKYGKETFEKAAVVIEDKTLGTARRSLTKVVTTVDKVLDVELPAPKKRR